MDSHQKIWRYLAISLKLVIDKEFREKLRNMYRELTPEYEVEVDKITSLTCKETGQITIYVPVKRLPYEMQVTLQVKED